MITSRLAAWNRRLLVWFDVAEAPGMSIDDMIFTIGVVLDLPSLDLTSCSASLLEAVAADDSVASGS
jgi:hypothetical protein